MKNALVIGAGKSGTSGLCFALAKALNMRFEFEHDSGVDRNVIRKKLLGPACYLNADRYEHVFFLTRDPRDRFISALVYGLTTRETDIVYEADKAIHFFKLFRRKETERDFPVSEIFNEAGAMECLQKNMNPQLDSFSLGFYEKNKDIENFHLVFFSDICKGDFNAVEKVVRKNLIITMGPLSHLVYRINRAEQWRDWFTQTDVEKFREISEAWGRTYGIEIDHRLECNKINSAVCSEWFANRVNQNRANIGLPKIEFEKT